MTGGYMGKVLRVNLTNGSIKEESYPEDVLRAYIGGSGLGAKILFEETSVATDPLGPDNLLIIVAGPLTGTPALSSGRIEVITRSPLTGIYGESNVGGTWGEKLKKSGFDGAVFSGKADRPVYLWINDGKVEIRDAAHVWGKDTFETDEILKRETDSKASVCCIGQAGEKLVRIAAIMTDGVDGRAAGRCGVGAVMGSKNLKAIVVNGNQKIPVADEVRLMKSVRELAPKVAKTAEALGAYGTSVGVMTVEAIGDLPIKNWYQGKWEEGAEKISGQAMAKTILTRQYHCSRCVIGCGRTVHVKEGKYASIETGGPEYETIGLLGSGLLIDDLAAVQMGNELCNRYGVDTISAGGVIGFAMEAFQKGIITKEDTGGIELTWGNTDAMIEMIKQIGEARGLGKTLGQGVVRAAGAIGKCSIEFAVHAKGLDFPAHDPRAKYSSAVSYATSNRGACHLQAFSYEFEEGVSMADLGYPETLDRFSVVGKGKFTARFQDLMSMFDSLSVCKFLVFGGVVVTDLVDWLGAVTGWDITLDEFLKAGERIYNLKRLYNNRLGISRKDDVLPPRMVTHKRGAGGAADNLPPLGQMLSEYYEYRGWSEEGVPVKEKLAELGLEEYSLQG